MRAFSMLPVGRVFRPAVRVLQRHRRPIAAIVAFAVLGAAWLHLGPLPAGLLDEPTPSTTVVDRTGVPLYEARSGDGTRGVKLTADTLPPLLVAATVAAEDRRFWSHPGVDPIAIVRAARTNLVERSVVEGGSTITQQVAKLLLNRKDPQRSRGWRAKAYEAVLALRLERRFSKREILAMYLNLAAYGNQIAGVERASRAYFGVGAGMLTPAQAAFLSGLPQRPSGFNPYRNRDAAVSRQRAVLRRMEAAGTLTTAQVEEARAERLNIARQVSPFLAPHFVEMVLADPAATRAERIETTLDAQLQADVVGVIESHREALRRHGASNVAVAVLDNKTGEWLAWEGSGNYADATHGGAINGPLATRQPGSALKPFTYALAFEEGFSPASVLPDIPSSFPTAEEGIVYSPRNYDGRFRGPMLVRVALAGSENVPAVALASELGVPKLLRFFSRAGLTTFEKTAAHYGLGLTLGNAEVRLAELVSAYAMFARGGEWIEPTWRPGADRESRRVVSSRTAFWITDILSDADAREYAFGRGGSLELPFPVAVKTGTSQAYHDNWTIGYSRHVTVGVWVGNFDRRPLRNSSGVTGAAPIFHGVMLAAERRAAGGSPSHHEILVASEDSAQRAICALSGHAANDWCPTKRLEWVAAERPLMPCNWHQLSDQGVITDWPAEYRAWVGTDVGRLVRTGETAVLKKRPTPDLPGLKTRPTDAGATQPLRIVSPANGSTFLIDPTLRREFQTVSLRAVAAAAGNVEWTVNGETAGRATADSKVSWALRPGRHHIVARDDAGRVAEAHIVVR